MGIFSKITQAFTGGLNKTATGLNDALRGMVGLPNGRVNDEQLQELEDALLLADVGIPVTTRLIDKLRGTRFADGATEEDVKRWLAGEITDILTPCEPVPPLAETVRQHPASVVLFVGVNGSGKTTTIGKLAHIFKGLGMKVLLAAGDTFRAGAAAQLRQWSAKAATDIVEPQAEQTDPSALLFQAHEKAVAEQYDVLLADTAGRLQNRTALMDELNKMVRVLKKQDDTAPHATVLVLDATVGQNALAQVAAFKEVADVTHLVLTKLDGSAKGGVILALADQFKLPIAYVGMGEKLEDLHPFSARSFAYALLGLAGDIDTDAVS